MQETIEELKDIISELVQDEEMCSLTYYAILTRLDYLDAEFLKLHKHSVSNRRELLIDFLSWYHRPDNCLIDHVYPDLAEQYLKSINSC